MSRNYHKLVYSLYYSDEEVLDIAIAQYNFPYFDKDNNYISSILFIPTTENLIIN